MKSTQSKASLYLYSKAKNKAWQLILISAVLLGIAFPPFSLAPVLFFAFVPILVLAETTKKTWKFFLQIYAVFFLWHLIATYWLMLTAINAPSTSAAISSFFAGFVAGVANSLIMTIPWVIYRKVYHKLQSKNLASFSIIPIWLAYEFLHLNWDLTWSWLNLGNAFSYFTLFVQYIEWTGILGISLIVLLGNVLFYNFIKKENSERYAFAFIFNFFAPILISLLLYFTYQNKNEKSINVRIIQPNIDPYHKFAENGITGQINKFNQHINSAGVDSIDLAILPETAIPQGLWTEQIRDASILLPLWNTVYAKKIDILTGMTEYRRFTKEKHPLSAKQSTVDPNLWYDHCNSAVVLKPGLVKTYQKAKLVPLVERVPFLEYLDMLESFHIDLGDGTGSFGVPDSSFNLQTSDSVLFAPLICYESTFGEFVSDFSKKNAGFLAVITNDAWWEQSSGYIQHAHLSRLRAIENRKYIVRSANTGISMIINDKGKVVNSLAWDKTGFIDGKIPILNRVTFYAKYGDFLGRIAVYLSFFIILLTIFASFRKKHE